MELEAGKEITQNDINRKLFEEIAKVGDEVVRLGRETRAEMKEFSEKLDTRMLKFEEKLDTRMIRFEDSMNTKMNWQFGLFGLFLTAVLVMMGIVAKIIPITTVAN